MLLGNTVCDGAFRIVKMLGMGHYVLIAREFVEDLFNKGPVS